MSDNSNIGIEKLTAVILAGGLGTRLRSVVSDRPKVLADIHGRPFLSWLLDHLALGGIRQVVLCTGYLGEMVEEVMGHTIGRLQLFHSQETSPLGTAGAIRQAAHLFPSYPILVMNGDSFIDVDLQAFLSWYHREEDARIGMVTAFLPSTERYGRIVLDDKGKIQQFVEKGQKGFGWVNAGIYLFGKDLVEAIPEKKEVSMEKEIFPQWVSRGLYGYPCDGELLDIGTPESYNTAGQFFIKRRPKK